MAKRAAVIDSQGYVVNFCLVEEFTAEWIDPRDSVIGSRWTGTTFVHPKPTGPTPEEQYQKDKAAYLDTVRDLRERVLARLNGYAATLMLKEPPQLIEERALVVVVIQGLLDITTIPSVNLAGNMNDLKNAVKAEYARLVSLCSTEMVKAFRRLDL